MLGIVVREHSSQQGRTVRIMPSDRTFWQIKRTRRKQAIDTSEEYYYANDLSMYLHNFRSFTYRGLDYKAIIMG